MVTGLLVIDLIILIVWQVLDPLQRKLESFPLEDPASLDDDIKIHPELEHCESNNNTVWLSESNIVVSYRLNLAKVCLSKNILSILSSIQEKQILIKKNLNSFEQNNKYFR